MRCSKKALAAMAGFSLSNPGGASAMSRAGGMAFESVAPGELFCMEAD